MQASESDLVGQNGTILARLGAGTAPNVPGVSAANGNLTLFDGTGKERLSLSGGGRILVFEPDGRTTRFQAGYALNVAADGVPAVDGVQLDANGTIDYLPASP